MSEPSKMKDAEKLMTEIESRISTLNQMGLACLEKTQVHQLSARLINLSEKLNRLAYMNLYAADGADGKNYPTSSYLSMFDHKNK